MERIRPPKDLCPPIGSLACVPRPYTVTPTPWLFHAHLHCIPVWLTPAGGQKIWGHFWKREKLLADTPHPSRRHTGVSRDRVKSKVRAQNQA